MIFKKYLTFNWKPNQPFPFVRKINIHSAVFWISYGLPVTGISRSYAPYTWQNATRNGSILSIVIKYPFTLYRIVMFVPFGTSSSSELNLPFSMKHLMRAGPQNHIWYSMCNFFMDSNEVTAFISIPMCTWYYVMLRYVTLRYIQFPFTMEVFQVLNRILYEILINLNLYGLMRSA